MQCRQLSGVTFDSSPTQLVPGGSRQALEKARREVDSRQSSEEPANENAAQKGSRKSRRTVSLTYMMYLGQLDPAGSAADGMVPMFTLGSTHVLARADAT